MKARRDPHNPDRMTLSFNRSGISALLGGLALLVLGIPLLPVHLLAGLFALGGAAGSFYLVEFHSVVVDAAARTLTIESRTWQGKWSRVYSLDEFTGVGLEAQDGERGKVYCIAFVRDSGERVTVERMMDDIDVAGKRRAVARLADLCSLEIASL